MMTVEDVKRTHQMLESAKEGGLAFGSGTRKIISWLKSKTVFWTVVVFGSILLGIAGTILGLSNEKDK